MSGAPFYTVHHMTLTPLSTETRSLQESEHIPSSYPLCSISLFVNPHIRKQLAPGKSVSL
ncbi:hypothetical protein BJX70DRAFT_375514 [Aspergillus crustosus]